MKRLATLLLTLCISGCGGGGLTITSRSEFRRMYVTQAETRRSAGACPAARATAAA